MVYTATAGIWLCLRTDWEREVKKVVARMEKERIEAETMQVSPERERVV